jgi:hypothetical protein
VTKRADEIPRPAPELVRAADSNAASGWDELARQLPSALHVAWVAITSNPRRTERRQHRLKGSLDSATVAGISLEQRQYEVSGGARIWYAIDDANRTLWITQARTGHQKSSERVNGRGSKRR